MRKAGSGQHAAGSKSVIFCCLLPAACCLLISGCSSSVSHPAGWRATQIDPAQASPDYWLNQPAITGVEATDFDALWKTCRSVMHDRFFVIDREDFREGLLTTAPLVSKQYWEIWRRDVVTVPEIADSTLATIRRTVRIQFTRQKDGRYLAEPKVLVERAASAERRITAISDYHSAFIGPRPFGSPETDEGLTYPTDYWYAIGRDKALERDLANAIERKIPA